MQPRGCGIRKYVVITASIPRPYYHYPQAYAVIISFFHFAGMVCKFLVVIVLLSVLNRAYGCQPDGTPTCNSSSDCTGVGIGNRVAY